MSAAKARLVPKSRAKSRRAQRIRHYGHQQRVLEHVRSLQQPGITLDAQLQAPAACVRGDPLQAYQAVLNLCVNAVQAMPQGGMLRVLVEGEQRAKLLRIDEQEQAWAAWINGHTPKCLLPPW